MSASMKKPSAAPLYDIVIVGGGMTGSLFACALGGSSLKVAIVERQPTPEIASAEYDLRVSALTLASRTMLQTLGAWDGIANRRSAPVRAMHVWDANGGGEIHFDAVEIGESALAYIIENRVIVASLRERLQQYTNVHAVSGAIVDVALDGERQVMLEDGRSLRARLVVAADGAESPLRERLKVARRTHEFDQQAIVANVRTERAHQGVALQRFLPTGPLAFLPLAEPHLSSIVWSADTARAKTLLALDDAAFCRDLETAIEGRVGAVESSSARAAFPLSLAHSEQYVLERVALIGDAAHTVHPLAGQGANLGFLDAATLAEVLLKAAQEERDIGAPHVLRRYERWRKGENLQMIATTGAFKYFFGNEHAWAAALRNFGLSLTDRIAPVKRVIMRRACGLEGDLPRLARNPVEL